MRTLLKYSPSKQSQAVIDMTAVYMPLLLQTAMRPTICVQLGKPSRHSTLPFQSEIFSPGHVSVKVTLDNETRHSGAHRRLLSSSPTCAASDVDALPLSSEEYVEAGDDFTSNALISSRAQVIFHIRDRVKGGVILK